MHSSGAVPTPATCSGSPRVVLTGLSTPEDVACYVTRRTQSPPVRLVTEPVSTRSAGCPLGKSVPVRDVVEI